MAARYSHYIKLTHFVGDLLILNAANVVANYLKFDNLNIVETPKEIFLYMINIVWLGLIVIYRPYEISRVTQVIRVIKSQASVIALHFLIITSFYFFANQLGYSREYMLEFYALLLSLNIISKTFFVILIRRFREKGFNFKKIIIVGFGKLSSELGNFIHQHPEYGYKLLGYFGSETDNENIIGDFGEIENFVLKQEVDEIYCCVPYADSKLTSRLVDFGEENLISVKLIIDFREFSFKRMEMERYGNFPVINITSSPLDDFRNKLAKRTFDILISLFVIVFILPWLTPIIALIIKFDSRGPVFFRQKRTGLRNRTFNCIKFRTMTAEAPIGSNGDGQVHEITGVGGFLRRFSIDELPQFINVLIGDMSVIGPRPHMLRHTEEFKMQTEKFMARHSIKPGITGLAQTRGYRGEIKSRDFLKNRVLLDRFYIENWSLFFDMKIIFMTFRDVFANHKSN